VKLRTEGPAHGGTVVARQDGRAVFVQYALPEELVEAEPWGRRGGAPFARAVRVLEPSAQRVDAKCPHFGECGGCQWQHAAYPLQLEMKRRVVSDIWSRAGLRLPPDAPVLGMDDPWRYRIRGEFDAIGSSSDLEFGFHRLRSHSLLPISTCPIHDQRIERALFAFRDALRQEPAAGIQNLQLTVEPEGRGMLWTARFRGAPRRRLGAGVTSRVAAALPELVLLDDAMTLEFWGLSFRVRSDTFVQTNYRQMLALYETALEMLDPDGGDAVLDLYAGIGTISVALARRAGSVTAVEENPQAVALGRLNARINSARIVYLPGRVEVALRQVRLGGHRSAILDPPRAGCSPAAIAELLRLGPERIVYVSCEPSTHARDLAALIRGGYRIRRAAIVDMFPQTYHVETVASLDRA
jgi:23S rRNA (uracil1939-C5)-methyltransferase